MRYQDALIAWTPGTNLVRVGPLITKDGPDWTDRPVYYVMTGGAAEAEIHNMPDGDRCDLMMMIEFNTIVVADRVPAEAVHREFLKIDNYRRRIAPDTPGLAAYISDEEDAE